MTKGTWAELVGATLKDAFAAMAAEIAGEKYESKIIFPPIQLYKYRCIKSFKYEHHEQDVNFGDYEFKVGEIYSFKDKDDPMGFCADRSNFEFISEESK